MNMGTIHRHQYDNGLVLLVEPMPGVASAGVTFLVPAGASTEAADQAGVGTVLSEMLFRGAGSRDAREHSDALDRLGVHRSANVQTHHHRLSATALGERLDDALPLLFDMVQRPRLPDEAFEPARQLALQSIDSLEDEPQEKVMVELKRQHLPDPFGRPTVGSRDALEGVTAEGVREFHRQRYRPGGAILGIAGNVDFDRVRERVGDLVADWDGSAAEPAVSEAAPRGYQHLPAQSTQAHIGVAFDAPAEPDPRSILQRLAVAVLSGGMSGRLFTEVRERRGLCYAVHAAYAAHRDRGGVFAYAGTTAERAAETLDVLRRELERIADGITEDEFERAWRGLKSRVVMQGESTGARAGAIATDQFLLGRPRSLGEVTDELDAVSGNDLNAYVSNHRPGPFTTLTIGPEALE